MSRLGRSLPPLGGRSVESYRAHLLARAREVLDPKGLRLDPGRVAEAFRSGATTAAEADGSITRAFICRLDDASEKRREIRARVNTSHQDRHGTVLLADGMDLTNYRRSPVVLWAHGLDPQRGELPIGRAVDIRPVTGPDGPELVGTTRFFGLDDDGDEFAERLFRRYLRGDMNSWSIRLCPDMRHCGPPTRDELKRRPDWEGCICVFRRGDLAEYSAVGVASNAHATTIPGARSLGRPSLIVR